MSKKDENNSQKMPKNNSIQNINYYSHNRNKSNNILTDSPSTQITAHIHSLNSNQNSKNKNRKNNNNDLVQYVNNDKYNFKGNFLNKTQNYSKYILTTPNAKKNHRTDFSYIYGGGMNIFTEKKNADEDYNNKSEKKIFFIKDIKKRKKSYEIKNKNILNEKYLNDVLNKNITNPEELHFFYVKMLQNGKNISKKFEFD